MIRVSREPLIIQGGMGAAVSDWRVAQAVCRAGQLGVVSGTGIDTVLVRRLQDGDPEGHVRRAMQSFPLPATADAVLRHYFRPQGLEEGESYRLLPLLGTTMTPERQRLSMLAAFVEVFLAREGHGAPVGINLLTKIQLPTLPLLYGAMLAGVDTVLMGAGVPREIPAALDQLAAQEPARLRLEVDGQADATTFLDFDPRIHWGGPPPALERPRFLPIVSSNLLANLLARKSSGSIDGLVVERPAAGGHNAPPRGETRLSATGQPIYGARDVVDLPRIRDLGLPFWIAGGAGRPGQLTAAREAGAAGVQVGTLFAFCDESGLAEPLKRSVLAHAARGEVVVHTSVRSSPTGYPFKVVDWPENPATGSTRERVCDLGYLRTAYRSQNGDIAFRCPGEPEAAYVRKGGRLEDTVGRQCLCNALLAVIGHAHRRGPGFVEPPIVTSGDDLATIARFLRGRTRYTAADVVRYILAN